MHVIIIVTFLLIWQASLIDALDNKPIWKGPKTTKIALTFDDGPHPILSKKLLKILKTHRVRGTFFLVGNKSNENPDIVNQIQSEGHEIGNHSYNHDDLTTFNESEMINDLTKTNKILETITDSEIKYFRPPGGKLNTKLLNITGNLNLKMILWNINASDYKLKNDTFYVMDESKNKQKFLAVRLIDHISSKARGGDIILFHNGSDESILLLPDIIKRLRNDGFTFVTMGELLDDYSKIH